MSLEESAAEFSAPHQWLCGGAVLRMEEPAAKDNMALFKVNIQQQCFGTRFYQFSASRELLIR